MDDLKSRVYLTWAEWGPAATIPRAERLATCYPEISAEERAAWMEEFAQISGLISATYDEFAAGTYSDAEFSRRLQEKFPFMNEAAVQKALFLANYYWWHG